MGCDSHEGRTKLREFLAGKTGEKEKTRTLKTESAAPEEKKDR
jgi:hypothetical protein